MSETRYTDDDKSEPGTAEAVEEEFEVELAGLNDSELGQVRDALTEAEFNGELGQLEIDETIQQAQFAEEDRAEAELAQREQAKEADAGDFEAARERAEEVRDNLQDASGHGASLEKASAENANDVQVLTEAEFQQDTAEYFGDAAVDYAEDGSEDSADASADDAADAADIADEQADQGDQDGTYGDQSIYTDNA
ncbi:MAG: hypothetical protein RIC56_19865 [Pseudomonadales bacterium]